MAKINLEEADLCCDSCEVHENLVKIVNETMPDETELYDLAELFKVFGDSTRIQILFVLFEAEVCVCDLAEALHMTQSAISHQLRILKQNKLVNVPQMRNFICGTFLLFTFILYLVNHASRTCCFRRFRAFWKLFFYFVYITELCKAFLEFHDLYSSE